MSNVNGKGPRVALITALVIISAILLCYILWKRSPQAPPTENTNTLVATNPIPPDKVVFRKSKVVIQTGPERLTNAVRCMLYTADLANSLPKERDGIKRHVAALAGVLYFNDCLMSKMSNGSIEMTTNELRQNFSNALAEMFTNHIPPEIVEGLNNRFTGQTNLIGEFLGPTDVTRELVLGFKSSFQDRNNMRVSVDEQYERMAQSPQFKRTLDALDSTFQAAGVTDVSQSDLKEMCLGLGETRTVAYLIYGPQSDTAMPDEYKAYAETLEKVLKWRLVNMYGLDQPTADRLVDGLSRVPVNGLSHAGLQVPAYIH